MSVSTTGATPLGWIANQPYLLLTLPSLFWAGNAIVGRAAAGHIPPFTLSFLRWALAFAVVLPFAWRALKQDWPVIRAHLGFMMFLSLISIGLFNSLQYIGLQYTTALNSLLLQSAAPLFVAIWSLLILGIRLTAAQATGILVSMIGVLVILLHGNLATLASIELNKGDLLFLTAMAIFGLYSVLVLKRPPMQQLSFLGFTFGCGALFLVPTFVWELLNRPHAEITGATFGSLIYVALFPSVLAYLCFNRGIRLIGANRSAPFFHLIPVFGSAMAIFLLGEQQHLFHVAGYALVLCGIVVAARKPKQPAVAVAEVPPT
jgi:drug/metabolite transporter (DMT)-like permease